MQFEYYNNNNSIISDREYDELFDILIVLERETGCIFSNSPTQSVGYMSLSQLQKVKHSHPLLSLGKTTDIDEFIKYFGNKDFLIMAKLDGLTCSLTYDNGKLIRAESRGDGETGEDITHNAKVFSNLPTEIPFKGKLEIDGECIITYDEFERIKARENTEYKNPRNLVSGSVRQLNSEIAAKRNIKFIAWRLHEAENVDIQYHSEGFEFLSNLGFDVVPYYTNSFNTIEWIKDECETKQIPIDGIVGMFDDIEYGNSLGRTGHHPRHSLAYKFYQEENETVLLNGLISRFINEYKIPVEDATMALPIAYSSKMVDKRNPRNLIDMSRNRMCSRAYWEFRELFNDIITALKEYSPEWATLIELEFMPKCEYLGFCPEKHSCGRKPKKNAKI